MTFWTFFFAILGAVLAFGVTWNLTGWLLRKLGKDSPKP